MGQWISMTRDDDPQRGEAELTPVRALRGQSLLRSKAPLPGKALGTANPMRWLLHCAMGCSLLSIPPVMAPCPDRDAKFIEFARTHLVRLGYVNANDRLDRSELSNERRERCEAPGLWLTGKLRIGSDSRNGQRASASRHSASGIHW
jgi:hypothetical protein